MFKGPVQTFRTVWTNCVASKCIYWATIEASAQSIRKHAVTDNRLLPCLPHDAKHYRTSDIRCSWFTNALQLTTVGGGLFTFVCFICVYLHNNQTLISTTCVQPLCPPCMIATFLIINARNEQCYISDDMINVIMQIGQMWFRNIDIVYIYIYCRPALSNTFIETLMFYTCSSFANE